MAFFICVLVAALASAALTSWIRVELLKRRVLDTPNERSSHTRPVPRGGGLAVVAVVILGLGLFFMVHAPFVREIWLLLSLGLLVGVSWLDDRKGLGAGFRLVAHVLAAMVGSLALTPEQSLFAGFVPFWLDRAVMILGWVWFMNLTNFMDGIDGITGVETIFLAGGVALLLALQNVEAPFVFFLAALLIGSCLGFLKHNWHPATIFLGDVGSVPLGFLTGYLLIVLALDGHLLAALLLPLYYLADSGITILKRLVRGEKIWHAHRQHFYQRAALAVGRHDRVVLWIVFANVVLLGAGWLVFTRPYAGLALATLSVAVLLCKMENKA